MGRVSNPYLVVIFENEGTAEVIPSTWMLSSGTQAYWPGKQSATAVAELIKGCSNPNASWHIFDVKKVASSRMYSCNFNYYIMKFKN